MTISLYTQIRRINAIVAMIRKGVHNQRLANCSDFVEEFSVTRQTVMSDLRLLRTELKAPIQYNASRKGYYLSDSTWCLPALKLERKEVFALGIARKLMTVFRGTPLEDEMHRALSKLASNLDGFVSIDPVSLDENVTVLGDDYVPQDPDMWLKIARCTQKHEQVCMRYVKFNGEQKEYTINPYHLAAYHGEWYLLGHHLKRKCEVTFAVSRIKKIKGLGLYFPPPVKELIEENLARGFGINHGGPVYDVHLRCTPKISSYIAGRVWHDSQRIERRKDGSVDLFMKTSGWKELVRFVLSWQPDLAVMAPVELRERIKQKMLDALKENYYGESQRDSVTEAGVAGTATPV